MPARPLLSIVNFSLDPRIIDPHLVVAEQGRTFKNYVQKYTIIIPHSIDTEVRFTESSTAYGVGGNTKLIQLVRMYRKAVSLITHAHYDVLTVHDTYYVAFMGWCIARRYGLGFEIQVHGFEKFSGVRALLAKMLLPRADAIRVTSARLKHLLVTQFKIPEEKITIAPLFAETSENPSQPPAPKLMAQKKNDFVFVTIARLVAVKNIALQIKAFKNLVAQYPDTQLWIVGDGPERARLEKVAHDLAVADKVVFWGWQADPSVFYAHADSYVLSSDSEGWGLVILEAAGYRLPIIMTDVGCAGEFIKDGTNGLVVPPGDDVAFEAAMLRLRADAMLRQSLGQTAKDSLASLPSEEELIQRYVASWERAAHLA
jgi:glycosyltransferase involved in cell wall biosynthesis